MRKVIVRSIVILILFFLLLLFAGCADEELKGKTLTEIQEEAQEAEGNAGAVEAEPEEEMSKDEAESQDEPVVSEVIVEPQEGERLIENESAAPVVEEMKDDLKPATILSESTVFEVPGGGKTVEEASFFANIRCKIRGSDGDRALGSAYPDDELSFTLTNRDEHDFFLGYYRKGMEYDDIPQYSLRILINGRKIDDLETICGTLIIKAGETIECRKARSVIKTGESFTGRPYDSKLEADGGYVLSRAIFACDGT